MNSHGTRAIKTKGITTTLLISSSVLAGLMAMSLSLPQTASADQPTCPTGTVSHQGNKCFGEPPTCQDPDQHLNEQQNKCVGGGEPPSKPECDFGFTLQGGQCVARAEHTHT